MTTPTRARYAGYPGFVENRMTYDMDGLDFSIGHQQSMFKIEILPIRRCTLYCLLNTGSIVWMSSL
jgi:hypothetical protein